MSQRVFTFYSEVDVEETIGIITNVVSRLNGKTKVNGSVITAKWWKSNMTLFPHKFTFYVGKDVVRVVTGDFGSPQGRIGWEFKLFSAVLKLWNEFVIMLLLTYRTMNFELEPGKFHIVSAKIMTDGIEHTYNSTSVSSPSIGKALIGGALFGGVGAIVGGSGGKTHTTGSTVTTFSDTVLVTARYSNGLNLEGAISKKSSEYHKILAGLCETSD